MSIFSTVDKKIAYDTLRSAHIQYDSKGEVISEADVRVDESQKLKFQEIIQLFLVAGYFRCRIQSLSEFDKIVGGLVWCISTSNEALDLNIVHLFQENLNIRQKIFLTEKIVSTLLEMKCPHLIEPHQIQGLDCVKIYPIIQWLVKKGISLREKLSLINQFRALEWFSRYFEQKSCTTFPFPVASDHSTGFEVRKNQNLSLFRDFFRDNLQEIFPHGGFSENRDEDTNSDQTVSKTEISSKHHRESLSLPKLKKLKLNWESRQKELEIKLNEWKGKIEKLAKKKARFDEEIEKKISSKNQINNICHQQKQTVEENVARLFELRKAEINLKESCREKNEELSRNMKQLKIDLSKYETKTKNAFDLWKQQNNLALNLRLELSKVHQEYSLMNWKRDSYPSRTELVQYQNRFLELTQQLETTQLETKQIYTDYNILLDTREYLNKEISLLDSVHESFEKAISSSNHQEAFLSQFSSIIQGVQLNVEKMKKRNESSQKELDRLKQKHRSLLEEEAKYFQAVKELEKNYKIYEKHSLKSAT